MWATPLGTVTTAFTQGIPKWFLVPAGPKTQEDSGSSWERGRAMGLMLTHQGLGAASEVRDMQCLTTAWTL